MKPVTARIKVEEENTKPISEHLIGVFFEDLNYAADGGLYAELIQNRDFEYSPKDGNKDKDWNSMYAWSVQGIMRYLQSERIIRFMPIIRIMLS